MDSVKLCPLDGAPSEVLVMANEYRFQCIKCGNRFNEAGEIRPTWDDGPPDPSEELP